jgi:integrase
MLATDFLSRIYRPLRLRGRSGNTVRLHECTLRAWGRWLQRPPAVDDLADDIALAAYLEHRAVRLSPWTVERERCSLLALARLARERGLIDVMPVVPGVPLPLRTPTAWSVDQMARLFAAAQREPGVIGGVPAGEWWRGLLLLGWESGERIGAILAAEFHDLQPPHLTIGAEARKGRRSDRVYHLSPACCEALRAAHSPGRRELLWWPGCRTGLWDRFRRLLVRARLGGSRVGFHQLRRSAASHFAAAGGDAAAFLGHAAGSGGRVAAAWYVDPRLQERRPPHELLPGISAK